jgi:hypothetical protein
VAFFLGGTGWLGDWWLGRLGIGRHFFVNGVLFRLELAYLGGNGEASAAFATTDSPAQEVAGGVADVAAGRTGDANGHDGPPDLRLEPHQVRLSAKLRVEATTKPDWPGAFANSAGEPLSKGPESP